MYQPCTRARCKSSLAATSPQNYPACGHPCPCSCRLLSSFRKGSEKTLTPVSWISTAPTQPTTPGIQNGSRDPCFGGGIFLAYYGFSIANLNTRHWRQRSIAISLNGSGSRSLNGRRIRRDLSDCKYQGIIPPGSTQQNQKASDPAGEMAGRSSRHET